MIGDRALVCCEWVRFVLGMQPEAHYLKRVNVSIWCRDLCAIWVGDIGSIFIPCYDWSTQKIGWS